MLLVSYIQQYFNTSITVLTNRVWKLLIALFKVPNTGAFTVHGILKTCHFQMKSSFPKPDKSTFDENLVFNIIVQNYIRASNKVTFRSR